LQSGLHQSARNAPHRTPGEQGISLRETEWFPEVLHVYDNWVPNTDVTGFLCTVAGPDSKALVETVAAYVDLLERARWSVTIRLELHAEGSARLNEGEERHSEVRVVAGARFVGIREVLEVGRNWILQIT
jgi:hypothetical protein